MNFLKKSVVWVVLLLLLTGVFWWFVSNLAGYQEVFIRLNYVRDRPPSYVKTEAQRFLSDDVLGRTVNELRKEDINFNINNLRKMTGIFFDPKLPDIIILRIKGSGAEKIDPIRTALINSFKQDASDSLKENLQKEHDMYERMIKEVVEKKRKIISYNVSEKTTKDIEALDIELKNIVQKVKDSVAWMSAGSIIDVVKIERKGLGRGHPLQVPQKGSPIRDSD